MHTSHFNADRGDDDCNGTIDHDAQGLRATFYRQDGDGYGTAHDGYGTAQ